MLQERRCYDKGNWIVIREKDRVIVHRTNSNAMAHAFADRFTEESNQYHFVDEAAGIVVKDGE